MSSLDEDVIEEAVHRGESMLVEEFVGLVERSHDEQAGVPYETLTEYARDRVPERCAFRRRGDHAGHRRPTH